MCESCNSLARFSVSTPINPNLHLNHHPPNLQPPETFNALLQGRKWT